jgi:hypothetical protein
MALLFWGAQEEVRAFCQGFKDFKANTKPL